MYKRIRCRQSTSMHMINTGVPIDAQEEIIRNRMFQDVIRLLEKEADTLPIKRTSHKGDICYEEIDFTIVDSDYLKMLIDFYIDNYKSY